jgi:hypothetical protein
LPSTTDLRRKLLQYIKLHNRTCQPFVWRYRDVTHRMRATRIPATAQLERRPADNEHASKMCCCTTGVGSAAAERCGSLQQIAAENRVVPNHRDHPINHDRATSGGLVRITVQSAGAGLTAALVWSPGIGATAATATIKRTRAASHDMPEVRQPGTGSIRSGMANRAPLAATPG